MIYLGNAARSAPLTVSMLLLFMPPLLYSIFFLFCHPNIKNISLLSFTIISHCNSFWLQTLKMPENLSLLFTILFCFPHSRNFHLYKNEERGTYEKTSLCLVILNSELWSRCGVGFLCGFFLVCFFPFPGEEQRRQCKTPKTPNLLSNINYHCLCLVKTILNIPHLEHNTGYNYISSLHADGKPWNYLALFFLSHLTTRHNLLVSFTWALSLSQKIAYHSSSRFPVLKYLAMSLINLFLDYASFPREINNITNNTSTVNFNATQAKPPCALPGTFHNYFHAAFGGHILQLVLHHIPCHVQQSASHLLLGPRHPETLSVPNSMTPSVTPKWPIPDPKPPRVPHLEPTFPTPWTPEALHCPFRCLPASPRPSPWSPGVGGERRCH